MKSFVFTTVALLAVFLVTADARAQLLDKQKLLDSQTFWDNRDWDWYKANIPFFDSPDADINTTYYYRWELVTKHLTYGSPESGYSFTKFIDRPFWSGAYGSISCPAGHQLYEVRWLRNADPANDYSRYWFRTPGAQPRRYSTWLADAIWAVHLVHPNRELLLDLLPGMQSNYEGWEKEHFVADRGLFWQTGHDDGMEININSRQTQDTVRGAPGYRPTLNAYLYADALAIERVARLAGEQKIGDAYAAKAAGLKKHLQSSLWDAKREFFLQRYKNDEHRDGQKIAAGSLTYETGRFAGSPHGREEIGYVPWQFNVPDATSGDNKSDAGYEKAWRFLSDRKYFAAEFGPTTVEREDPMFALSKGCCWWSGQSWPYATSQTLVAFANLLNNYRQSVVTKADYFRVLKTYTLTHRKNGRPYIAEAANPDTGSWQGHDAYNHSEHYFHSSYNDLIITGVVGLRPRDDVQIEVNPLAPDDWAYFALEDVPYHDHRVTIYWDKTGKRYGRKAGLTVLVDGAEIAHSEKLERLVAALPPAAPKSAAELVERRRPLNYAVNNSGAAFPRAIASYSSDATSPEALNDGNYWYHVSPPNRWTSFGSTESQDWCGIDFGIVRELHTIKLYVVDDRESSDAEARAPENLRREKIVAPTNIELEYWDDKSWRAIPDVRAALLAPTGRRANVYEFKPLKASKVRAVFTHAAGSKSGLSEFEAWGDGELPVPAAPAPKGNLALNTTGKGFPQATASHTSKFDTEAEANDGRVSLRDKPHNRWTSYESKNASDWLAIDFGAENRVGRVDLVIYDDGGGVQAPKSYTIERWDGQAWQRVEDAVPTPRRPRKGLNSVTFKETATTKIRVTFEHNGAARSGVSEIEAYKQ